MHLILSFTIYNNLGSPSRMISSPLPFSSRRFPLRPWPEAVCGEGPARGRECRRATKSHKAMLAQHNNARLLTGTMFQGLHAARISSWLTAKSLSHSSYWLIGSFTSQLSRPADGCAISIRIIWAINVRVICVWSCVYGTLINETRPAERFHFGK